MVKYIDADKMLADEGDAYLSAQAKITDKLTRDINYVVHTKLQRLLADAPAADVVEVKHGYFYEDDRTYAGGGRSNYKCSVCGRIVFTAMSGLTRDRMWDFCPNCGARMLDGDINVLNKKGAKMMDEVEQDG